MDKGFVIIAQDTDKVSYSKCASILEKSIKKVMPDSNVTILTSKDLPYGDLAKDSDWKLINDWQIYEASPYEHTIKLEADMFIPSSIDYWWDVLKQRDVVVSTRVRNFKQDISTIRYYRKFIDDNNLPDCYNGITYFKKSKIAEDFYKTVRQIFENWEDFKKILKCNPNEIATTDFVYALACHIIGPEKTTLPSFDAMSMVHMKMMINDLLVDDWTKVLIYEILPDCLRINTVPQMYPFHYHVKDFAYTLGSKL